MNLYEKLLMIAKYAGVMKKNKSGFNYKYTTEDEILAKVTVGMQKHGVVLIPSINQGSLKITPYTYQKWDKKAEKEVTVNELIVSADMTFTWVNAENPEEKIEVSWAMAAQKDDVSQALGGALTYSNRYFMLKALQIATVDDDPDNYRSKQKEVAEYEKLEEIKELQANIIDTLKKKVDEGCEKSKLFAYVESLIGSKNPNKIKDIEKLKNALEDIKAVTPETIKNK
jgi:hypothetical protein